MSSGLWGMFTVQKYEKRDGIGLCGRRNAIVDATKNEEGCCQAQPTGCNPILYGALGSVHDRAGDFERLEDVRSFGLLVGRGSGPQRPSDMRRLKWGRNPKTGDDP